MPAKILYESLKLARTAVSSTLSFHSLRHFFTSNCVMAGVDFMTVARWLGHQDGGILVARIYGHLADEHRRRMAEKVVFTPVVMHSQAASV